MERDSKKIPIALSAADWSEKLHGWNCAPLRIPSAHVKEMTKDGITIARDQYKELDGLIQWRAKELPPAKNVVAYIEIEEELALKKNLDEEHNRAERLKLLQIFVVAITAITTTAISSTVTWFATREPPDKIAFSFNSNSQDINNEIAERVRVAKANLWFFGTNFRTAADEGVIHEAILKAARSGVQIRFVVLDPRRASPMAEINKSFGYAPDYIEELTKECEQGLDYLIRLRRKVIEAGVSPDNFQIRLAEQVPLNRSYFFDPTSPDGSVLLIPYVNMIASYRSPTLVFKGGSEVSMTLLEGIKKSWNRSVDASTRDPDLENQ